MRHLDKNKIERALSAASRQVPQAPSALVENMVRTANKLERERERQAKNSGSPSDSKGSSVPDKKKEKGKSL